MKKLFHLLASMLACALISTTAHAQAAKGTKDEAVALVKKAVEHMKAVGKEKALADFSSGVAPFKDRDLYVLVYDGSGKCIAHGGNAKLIGKDLIDLKDADGFEIVKALVASAKNTPKGGWVSYRWPNAVTKVLEPKTTWVVGYEDLLVGVGVSATP
jgi:signal transduction histidine kinase